MFIINDIPEDIVVHVRSRDDDLGNHTLLYNTNYDWSFCFTLNTLFTGEFWWGSKYIDLNLVDDHVSDVCETKIWGTIHCYWLVRPEGFYIGVKNNSWPDKSWSFEKSWP